MSWVESITLKSDYCTLVPLSMCHHNDLVISAQDGELWNLKYATIPQPSMMKTEIKRRLFLSNEGEMVPFAVIHNKSHRAVGMTTYCKLNPQEKKLDIGWTWYAKSHWRTALNTNCKLLLLTHAFESLRAVAVYFKVHVNNVRSQQAVLRLGASFIELIRNYRTVPGKKGQDYNHYCISLSDWSRVRDHLIKRSFLQESHIEEG